MSKTEILKYIVLRSIGNFLLLFAIFGVIMTFGPALYLEVQYRVAQARGVRYTVKTPAQPSPLGDLIEHPSTPSGEQAPQQSPSFASVLTGSKEQVLVPKDTQFSILIPKIGANAKVIPNVDPSVELS